MNTEKPKSSTMLELIEKLDKHQRDYEKLEEDYTNYMHTYNAKRRNIERCFDNIKSDIKKVAIAQGINTPVVVGDVLIEFGEFGINITPVTVIS